MKIRNSILFRRCFVYSMVFCMMCLTTGCSVYKVVPDTRTQSALEKRLDKQSEYYFILHHLNGTSKLIDISLEPDTLRAYATVADSNTVYYHRDSESKRFTEETKEVVKEVHFYVEDSLQFANDQNIAVARGDISETRVIKSDDSALIAAFVIPAIVVAVVIIAISNASDDVPPILID